VQFLRSVSSADDVRPKPSFLARLVFGDRSAGEVPGVARPYGLTFDQGKLYACDSGARRGVVFDFVRKEFRTFGDRGADAFRMPINISRGPDGESYVTDTLRGQVLVLDTEDRPARALRGPEGMKPCDAVWHDGELFVADLGRNAVLVLDPKTGQLRRQIGRAGAGPGEFAQPTNLAFGPHGRLYVSDTLNARVQVLDTKGTPLKVIGSRGRALGQMVRPKGIAVDAESRLYVADAAAESVLVYDRDGRLLMLVGGPGVGRGGLSLPAKVALSREGVELFASCAAPEFRVEYLIFVSNQLGPNKINVYGFGTYQGPVANGEASRP